MALWLLAILLTGAAAGEPANEIVAVVEGAPITLWDVEVEARLASLEQRGAIPAETPASAELKQSLAQLVNQTLALHAADRFRVSFPTEGEVEQELRAVQALAPVPVDRQLAAAGIPESRLRLRLRAKLRIRRLIQERIREMVRVSDADVRAYVATHPEEVRQFTAEQPDADIAAKVREYLTAKGTEERSLRFFRELRERSGVDVLDARFR
jgi:hypothetical protein